MSGLSLLSDDYGRGVLAEPRAAIRHYTPTYLDRSVTTRDFQAAVEQSSGTGLSTFFEEWIAF